MEWSCFLEILGVGTEKEEETEETNAQRTWEEIVINVTGIKYHHFEKSKKLSIL